MQNSFFFSKPALAIQGLLIYSWLTVLSQLSGTDTYYSVYLLCGVAGLMCLCHNGFHSGVLTRKQAVTLTIFAALFSGAVALANYPLFSPLRVLQNCFDLVCTLLGGWVVGYQVLLWMLRRLPVSTETEARKHSGLVFWGVFLSVAAIYLGYLLFVLYPGVLTADSFATISQALGFGAYDNVMPFWHTVATELFVKLGLYLFEDINAAIALFHGAQILFLAACFGYALETLYRIGLPKWALAIVYILYALMPYNIVYSVTLWKDIPFAGAALLLVTALYRLLKNVGGRKRNLFALVVGAFGFSLLRTNGWYAFLVMTLLLFPLLWKHQKKLVLLLLAVLVVTWLMLNPLLTLLNVGSTDFVEAFGIPMQQIARVLHNERPLAEEDMAMLNEIFYTDRTAELYDPQIVDPVKFYTFRHDRVDYLTDHLWDYVRLYFRIGAQYPEDYWQAWVEQTKGYWNGGYKYWTYTLQMGENDFGIVQSPGDNLLARVYNAAFRYWEKPEILQCLISIGLYVWALVACCVTNVLKKRQEFVLTIPILVLIAGLWLGTPVFSEFRYAYPLILTLPTILSLTVWSPEKK